jgi:hypothetical protein
MTLYYDLILGLIPLVMAGVSGSLVVAGLDLTVAIPLAGLIALALIGHAMFVRAPGSAPKTQALSNDSTEFNTAD